MSTETWTGSWKTCERTRLHLSDEDTKSCKAWRFELANLQLDSMHIFLTVRSIIVAATSLECEISAITQCFQDKGAHLPKNAAVGEPQIVPMVAGSRSGIPCPLWHQSEMLLGCWISWSVLVPTQPCRLLGKAYRTLQQRSFSFKADKWNGFACFYGKCLEGQHERAALHEAAWWAI